ncbi:MAG: hypothetical protein ACJA2J_002286 [Candidatus Azotimanducaceae bacterium]|jgi:hypothetical protein
MPSADPYTDSRYTFFKLNNFSSATANSLPVNGLSSSGSRGNSTDGRKLSLDSDLVMKQHCTWMRFIISTPLNV